MGGGAGCGGGRRQRPRPKVPVRSALRGADAAESRLATARAAATGELGAEIGSAFRLSAQGHAAFDQLKTTLEACPARHGYLGPGTTPEGENQKILKIKFANSLRLSVKIRECLKFSVTYHTTSRNVVKF